MTSHLMTVQTMTQHVLTVHMSVHRKAVRATTVNMIVGFDQVYSGAT